MVRISCDLLQRCSSRHLLPEDFGNFFNRVTHLYLQGQNIRVIENLQPCKNVFALYLYDNRIEKVENLSHLTQLECLYLQNNKIQKIENLTDLKKITVLNLARNQITMIEGLENLVELRELYIEHQSLPKNKPLCFDQSSVAAIAKSLKTLNISGNQIISLASLRPLICIESLFAEDNMLWNVHEAVEICGRWKNLRFLKFNGNALCKVRKYKDNVVVNCLELEELDGKVVPQPYREFLLNWKQNQDLRERKKKSYEIMRPYLESQGKLSASLGSRSTSASRISGTASAETSKPKGKSAVQSRGSKSGDR